MATKPVISIDVQDEAFKKFYDLFKEYTEKLDEQPEAWNKLNDAMGGSEAALKNSALHAETLSGHIEGATKAQSQFNQSTKSGASGLEALGKSGSKAIAGIGKALSASADDAGSLFAKLATVAGVAGDAMLDALGPVGIMLGGIAALTGGTTAALKALADAGIARQRAAFRMGTTPGEQSAFNIFGQQFMGPEALSAAANAQLTIGNTGKLGLLGINFADAQKESPRLLAFQALAAASKAAQDPRYKGLGLTDIPEVKAYQALGFDVGNIRTVLSTPNGRNQLALALAASSANVAGFNLDPNQVNNGAKLTMAIGAAGTRVQSLAINKLSGGDPLLAKGIDFISGGPNATRDKIAKTIAGGPAAIGSALGHLGATVVQKTEPALHTLAVAASKTAAALGLILPGAFNSPAAAAVIAAAKYRGVDPKLALAAAMNESGMNPRSKGDYGRFDKSGNFIPMKIGAAGGHYTSFGLFQLHESGELGNLTPEQAFDPGTNAKVALANFARIAKLHPNWSPGQIAVTAQGADPAGGKYAADVNAYYNALVKAQRASRNAKPAVKVTVRNSTASRVDVSINAAAQF